MAGDEGSRSFSDKKTLGLRVTYQDPVPNCPTINTAAAFRPDSDGHRPSEEDNERLREVEDIFGPP